MRVYKELPLGITMMGISRDEGKSREERRRDADLQRVLRKYYRGPDWFDWL